ncbi:uncharacterized protein Gasu_35880 [Galdieria sulphuraria]|uniref:Uncharacterized protein n=1 Tax=Galdieria sulphuraria TaxID=130081 RepID=M2XZD9_GALSU|nr:uncharacterized protein Gasu_35880 [Galdieria sulphuraria]EME29018.1 hypothetical protein Gasu_35880 [Galdieria sulphuraria]|eukprot:XP_005705538.1 hypothetical protein Gasu_35880 [Galdieria sulphuraria]
MVQSKASLKVVLIQLRIPCGFLWTQCVIYLRLLQLFKILFAHYSLLGCSTCIELSSKTLVCMMHLHLVCIIFTLFISSIVVADSELCRGVNSTQSTTFVVPRELQGNLPHCQPVGNWTFHHKLNVSQWNYYAVAGGCPEEGYFRRLRILLKPNFYLDSPALVLEVT